MLGAGALGRPRGMVWGGGGRGVWDGEHMCACGGFILMFGKTSAIMYGKKNKKIKKKLKKKKKRNLKDYYCTFQSVDQIISRFILNL